MVQSEKHMYVIGLMSGTSLDGVDLVCVQFFGEQKFEIIHASTVPYSAFWSNHLKDIALYDRGAKELDRLDVELGVYYSKLIHDFINQYKITQVDLIASHGHTVHHQPKNNYTLQIGCGKQIYRGTGIKTVYDFRTQDVALGGQGAPLVPVGDELLFSQYNYCLNLGGFSNVSFSEKGIRKAFDICPVNLVLNHYANQLGYDYDKGGFLSKQGKVNNDLLTALNSLPFYQSTKPKSLGIAFLRDEVYPLLLNYPLPVLDVMATFVAHIARQITNKLKEGTVLVTGGGAYHTFLLETIQGLHPGLKIIVPKNQLVEYKEALIFALLGKLRSENKINCLASVTGAIKNHVSGVVIG